MSPKLAYKAHHTFNPLVGSSNLPRPTKTNKRTTGHRLIVLFYFLKTDKWDAGLTARVRWLNHLLLHDVLCWNLSKSNHTDLLSFVNK